MEDIISVIIPVYNVEAYIHRCLDSLLRQTYKNLEFILIDDGSTDASGNVCDIYVKQDSRFKVIHQKNAGLSEARNNGINIARGNYLTFVDPDDYVSEDYVEYLYYLIKNNNADISICKNIKTSNECSYYQNHQEEISVYSGLTAAQMNLYQKSISPSAWGKLYTSNLYKDIKYPKGTLYEDLGTTYKLLMKAKLVVESNQVKYYYWQNSEGIMRQSFSAKKMDRVKVAKNILDDATQNYPNLIKAAQARFFLANIQVLREIPYFGETFLNERLELQKNIKCFRRKVMCDPDSPRMTKLIAISSYFGVGFLKVEGSIYKTLIERQVS